MRYPRRWRIMSTINNIKEVRNTFCGKNKCTKRAKIRISFPLGFSALFCTECAEELRQKGIGAEKGHLNKEMKALDRFSTPDSNAYKRILSSSKEVTKEDD
jgi:hypothetical protein